GTKPGAVSRAAGTGGVRGGGRARYGFGDRRNDCAKAVKERRRGGTLGEGGSHGRSIHLLRMGKVRKTARAAAGEPVQYLRGGADAGGCGCSGYGARRAGRIQVGRPEDGQRRSCGALGTSLE